MSIDTLIRLRDQLQASDHILTDAVYNLACELCSACDTQWIRARTPEYDRSEFLLNVDLSGDIVQVSENILADVQSRSQQHPTLGHWFQPINTSLGIARWLAHLAGFRHRCIHLFLDLPQTEHLTLVQIRSLSKYNAPGCVDMPVAGHVQGNMSPEQSVREECAEELGLDLNQDVQNMRLIGTHTTRVLGDDMPNYHDVEHTTVYRGQLNPDALRRVQFSDGEVAALALYHTTELATLIHRHPEQVGSGLRDSFELYIQNA